MDPFVWQNVVATERLSIGIFRRGPAVIVKSSTSRVVPPWAMWSVLTGERAAILIFVNNRPSGSSR
jgi:hypothetical protein